MTTTTTAKQRAWSPAHPGFYLNVFSIVAAVGIAIVMTASRRWTGVGAAAAGGIAGFMVGGLLGFLFGIPRYATSAVERDSAPAEVVKYRANTNLEQISDWLTKIIVGVGLTQFRGIGNWMSGVAESLGAALTGKPDSDAGEPLALALLLLTSVCGFLFFYVWSRVYLPKIFANAEAEE